MAALQYVHLPGYSALLLRKTYPDLSKPGGLMPMAMSWLQGKAQWRASTKTWVFPSGATVGFGFLQSENDKYQFQGSELHFVGMDELSQFSESQYRYLFSRLRKPDDFPAPLRMRAGTNPGGTGHRWVKQRFIVEGQQAGRGFVPAKLEDNPYLDQDSYRRSLMELDHITRRQLMDGDWSVNQGGLMFERDWFEVVDRAPDGCQWCRFWDVAATRPSERNPDPDWTAGVLLGIHWETGVFYVADVRHVRDTPLAVERTVRQAAVEDPPDTMVRMEMEGGSAGPSIIDRYARTTMVGFNFMGVRPETNKIVRAKPVSAAAEQGNIKLVRGRWVTDFLDELEAFPSGGHDDQADALSGSFRALTEGQVMFA